MYINARERTNKKDIKVFYIYICVSRRIEGKVTNTQKYVGRIDIGQLAEKDFSFLDNPKFELNEVEKNLILNKLERMASEI